MPSCDNPTPESSQGAVILGSVVGSIAIGLFCAAVVFLVVVTIVVRHRKKHYSVNINENIGTHNTTFIQQYHRGKDSDILACVHRR